MIEASEGRAALELAVREQPDLVISDVMMPVMNGHQLLEALRANPCHCHHRRGSS